VELTELFFSRIETLDSQLHSYLFLAHDEAMESAKNAETAIIRGDNLGALHGLPISIKDTQMTEGIPTTQGSLLFTNRVPVNDSAVVERVKDAGAIILGKTNVSEFGLVGTCENLLGDYGRNPWDIRRTPGGSSGGAAAAVAASLCPLATGSDGGGSIRIPANFCGIYGIKPTQGRVSGYTGLESVPMPNTTSQNGPLSRTVRDSALLLQIIAGYDPRDPNSLRESPPDFVAAVDEGVKELKIAWSPDFGFADVDPEVLQVTTNAARVFEDLGCHVEEPNLTLEPPYDTYGPIITANFYTVYGDYMNTHGKQLTEYVKFFIERGKHVSATEYAKTLGLVDLLKAQMADLFQKYDLLLSPTACFPPFEYRKFPGEITGVSAYPEQYWNGAFTLPINIIGHPAATIPAGFSSNGLPIGLHIVGRKGGENTIISASSAFENARPWIQYKPCIL